MLSSSDELAVLCAIQEACRTATPKLHYTPVFSHPFVFYITDREYGLNPNSSLSNVQFCYSVSLDDDALVISQRKNRWSPKLPRLSVPLSDPNSMDEIIKCARCIEALANMVPKESLQTLNRFVTAYDTL